MSTLWDEGDEMAASGRNLVNLDALIPRSDLFGDDPPVILSNRSIRISDLEECAFYDQFRKPDFQRETANWTPPQVTSLRTFAESDIIPSVIFWQNGPHIFVIDGAHRLSALIAWVRDDYGSGKLSRNVFKDAIPAHQLEMHRQTQALVKDQVGTYADLKAGVGIFGLKELSAQWIEKSTALQAGEAFIRINQAGTPIDHLEVRILRAPRAALSLTALHKHLMPDEIEEAEEGEKGHPGERFSTKTKSAVTLDDLSGVPRCPLCGGLLHPSAMALDHTQERSRGGSSTKGNARYVHPVCNSNREKDKRSG